MGGVGRGGEVGVVEGYGRGKECFCLVKTRKKALAMTRRPVAFLLCLILFFSKGVLLPSLMMAGKAARSRVRRQTCFSVCLWLRAVWRADERL